MEQYLTFAKEIAQKAAEITKSYFGFEVKKEMKIDSTPVTQADREINKLVIERVNATFPEHGVFGEEESSLKKDSRYIWMCDPIDGTIPFLCGLPMFTFSLALVDREDGQPIVGVVNDPMAGNMYWAVKNSGAYRNGVRIHVNKESVLKHSYLNVEGGGIPGYSKIRVLELLKSKGAKAFKLMSFIYGAIQIANGKFASSIFLGPEGYEVATLKIITEEAGGVATDLVGNGRRYDMDGLGFVISNGLVHEELLNMLKIENFNNS